LRITTLAAAISCGFLVSGCGAFGASTAAPPAASGPIRLAAVGSLSGPNATGGVEVARGQDLAVTYLNAHGGVNGRQIELTHFDDQSSATTAIGLVDEIQANSSIIGCACTENSADGPAAAEIEKDQVPSVTVFADPNINTNPGQWVFREGAALASYPLSMVPFIENTLKLTKVGLLSEPNDYGAAYLSTFQNASGLTLVDDEVVQPNPVDDSAAISRIARSGAQIMVLGTTGNGTATAVRDWGQLGTPLPVLSGPGLANPAVAKLAEASATKVTAIATFCCLPTALPRQQALYNAYQQTYGKQPSPQSAQGWDTILLLVTALRHDSSDRAGLRAALETSIQNVQGADGVYTYSAASHQGVQPSGMLFVKYSGSGVYGLYTS